MGSRRPIHIYIFQIIALTCVFSSKNIFAQSQRSSVEDSLILTFNNRISPQLRLFNGVSYTSHFGKLEGNAYLEDNTDFVNGTVTYDGFVFNDVPILFDLVEGKVITHSSDGYNWYSLLNERLSNFTLDHKKFIYISPPKSGNAESGFFELCYAGKMEVLVKRTKSVKEVTELQGVKKVFYEKIEYFIRRENLLHKISSESGLLRLFEDQKLELKKYLRSKKLKFRDEPVSTLVSTVSYYEQLSN